MTAVHSTHVFLARPNSGYVPGTGKKLSKPSRVRAFAEALKEDRIRVEMEREQKTLWQRLKSFPWKPFAGFMLCWTLVGNYTLPLLRDVDEEGDVVDKYGFSRGTDMRVNEIPWPLSIIVQPRRWNEESDE